MTDEQIQTIIVNSLKFHEIPLSYKELYEKLIYDGMKGKVLQEDFIENIDKLKEFKKIAVNEEYIGLFGNIITEQVALREKKESLLRNNIKVLTELTKKFRGSNTVKFIGISGKLNLEGEGNEQQDLYVITEKEAVWWGRLLLSRSLGKKKDLYNLDYFSEEANIEFENHDLKSASELLSLKPIVNNEKTYESIVGKNMWVFDFFPNYPLEKISFNFGTKNVESDEVKKTSNFTKLRNSLSMKFQKGAYNNRGAYAISANSIRKNIIKD